MKVWNDQEYFRRKDDKMFSVPEWVVVLLVIVLFSLVVVSGIELITARKQLSAIERHISDCKGGRVGNLLMMPTKDCSAKFKIAIIEYRGK